MKILVCGGRDYDDFSRVDAALSAVRRIHPELKCVIHGGAKGADQLAAKWAGGAGIDVAAFPADWDRHGKAAGPIRNQRMLDEGRPDAVVAFPGGRGTADMIRRAKLAGLPVWELSR